MPKVTFKRGSFSIDLSFVPASGEVAVEDRQCAWQFYLELAMREGLRAKVSPGEGGAREGDLIIDRFGKLEEFSQAALRLAREYPVGRIEPERQDHLGFFITRMVDVAILPILEKWRTPYRAWWENLGGEKVSDPFRAQEEYTHLEDFWKDSRELQRFGRSVVSALQEAYGFVPLLDAVPEHVREDWRNECEKIRKEKPKA